MSIMLCATDVCMRCLLFYCFYEANKVTDTSSDVGVPTAYCTQRGGILTPCN